jgi:folate-dependent phosphoribosylglycinamide formyltransferase PurN
VGFILTKETKFKKVIVISPMKLRHRVFACELQKNNIVVSAVLIEKQAKSLKKKLKEFFTISQILNIYLTLAEIFLTRKVHLPETSTIYLKNSNDARIIEIVDKINPDAVVVYGGSIIPKTILQKISIPILNIHGAVLPGYRGLDSYWWLILDSKEFLQGYTIHYLDSGIDTGNIILSNQYSKSHNRFFRNSVWRLWIAKNSAVDLANLLINDLDSAPSVVHDLNKSTYRSKLSILNFALSRKRN